MAFWRKSGGKQVNDTVVDRPVEHLVDETEPEPVSPVETPSEPQEAPPETPSESLEEGLAKFVGRTEEFFAELGVEEPHITPTLALPARAEKKSLLIPKDELSLKIYLCLNLEGGKGRYADFIGALDRRQELEERLSKVEERLAKVNGEMKGRESAFEEVRFEEYLSSATDEEFEETEVDSLDLNEDLVTKRENYKQSVVMESQLQDSKGKIVDELREILLNIHDALPESDDLVVVEALKALDERLELLDGPPKLTLPPLD